MVKKIAIFGSSGQLGKEFKENYSFNTQFKTFYFSKSECNVLDHVGVEKILNQLKPDVVINCSAYTNVDGAEKDKELANNINNLAVENLAKLSNKIGFILIHFSTDYVFSKSLGRPFTETDKKNPVNYYGFTKHIGEEKIMNISKKYFIFRVSWLYGLFGNNFPKKIIHLTKSKIKLDVVNDQIGVPTSTLFVVDIVRCILSRPKYYDSFGLYNMVPSGECSWNDMANIILEKYKLHKNCMCKKINPVSSDKFKTLAKRPSYSVLSNQSLIADFKISPHAWDLYFYDFLDSMEYN